MAVMKETARGILVCGRIQMRGVFANVMTIYGVIARDLTIRRCTACGIFARMICDAYLFTRYVARPGLEFPRNKAMMALRFLRE